MGNTTESVFGSNSSEIDQEVVPVLDTKRGRGRPPKKTTNELDVKDPVVTGTLNDVLSGAGVISSNSLNVDAGSYAATKDFSITAPVSIEYKLVHDSKPSDLENKVNALLRLGWVITGSLVVTPMGLFVQSLTKLNK